MTEKIYGMTISQVNIETRILHSFRMNGEYAIGDCDIALATLETPLFPSVNRGKKAANYSGGIFTKVTKDEMTRSLLFYTDKSKTVKSLQKFIKLNYNEIEKAGNSTTRYGRLTSTQSIIKDNDLHLRIGMFTGDAAGHNMTTNAALNIGRYITNHSQFEGKVTLGSLSSNYCTDKKVALTNIKKGRGKSVEAKVILPKEIVEKILKTTPEKIHHLNQRKNYKGSELAGSIGSRNAHHGNMVAAVYLATGQDPANITGGSTGFTKTKITKEGNLEFKVELPTIIVGTVGNGKNLPSQRKHLEAMRCYGPGNPLGANAKKLAELIGGVVLCGELSLMAALTNNDELMKAHIEYERS